MSGARRVAAPVSRTGVQVHRLQPNKCGEVKSSAERAHDVVNDENTQRSSETTARSHAQPSSVRRRRLDPGAVVRKLPSSRISTCGDAAE